MQDFGSRIMRGKTPPSYAGSFRIYRLLSCFHVVSQGGLIKHGKVIRSQSSVITYSIKRWWKQEHTLSPSRGRVSPAGPLDKWKFPHLRKWTPFYFKAPGYFRILLVSLSPTWEADFFMRCHLSWKQWHLNDISKSKQCGRVSTPEKHCNSQHRTID